MDELGVVSVVRAEQGKTQTRLKQIMQSTHPNLVLHTHAKHFLHCKHLAYMRSVTHRIAVYLGLPQGGWLRDSEVP